MHDRFRTHRLKAKTAKEIFSLAASGIKVVTALISLAIAVHGWWR
ncbi:hypothetical protein J2W56_004254 [Nocardia kruczakiae]|uniref:Uncharacterized protein n=1 Tax=Nocardia kruczakiae TaxID=261477 RepID=A0ABU1XIY5_9NOCA|nr:hypothetical protein [Nocardia kruczakiae]